MAKVQVALVGGNQVMKRSYSAFGRAFAQALLLAGGSLVLAVGTVESGWAQEKPTATVSNTIAQKIDPTEFSQALDQEVKSNLFLSAISEHFPEVWSKFRLDLIEQVKAGKSHSEIQELSHNFGKKFMLDNVQYMSKAPDSALTDIVKLETLFIIKLSSSNVQLCADHTMSGLRPDVSLSPDLVSITEQVARARVIAIRKSMDKPVTRGAMTEDEWVEIFKLMIQLGLPVEILENAAGLQTAKPEVQCTWGVHLYQAMMAAPPELGNKAYAELITAAIQK
ncbi:MAG: hypothetical protein ACK41P_10880 [Asticcacaulis sp.]